ncbi:hypothetical protein A3F29_00460 [Candidatus Roizmanbacteria bacterium RIFCSPHIGHO2_12_FULL_33_9]|uniref:Polysaccharide biosynthesis protein C-terminal domain-containing protein n=1 Tax=Candidatus Roizmanbacteria bacterium RIFCSPHIGHO2_12_FULL_33_9 TaxID=1802045 RepID=A0A1F7HGX4_9BACT|nr:MAG: hypothetical protein A3F29_00460 [Candidatus Roizmanbacteria bacterium RIFCSPHIGHO2_12_FULL_33_9]
MKIFHVGKRILAHELISGSLYLFLGAVVSSFLAFLLNLFLARNLVPSDYGIFASLISLIILITIPALSINTIIVRFATDYFSKGEMGKGAKLYKETLKILSFFSLLIFGIFVLLSFPIMSFLHIDNIWYVILAGLIIALSYITVINTAFLQSLLKFNFLSFVNVASALIRLLSGVFLIILGFRVFGGLFAIISMSIVSFVLAFIPLRFVLREKGGTTSISGKEIFSYAIPTTVAIFFLTSFTSMDVILVKHFFNSSDAGLYGGLSLIGKVIYYFTGPITMVMFPLLIKRHTRGENFNNLFYLAFMLLTLSSFALTIFYYMFPKFVINFFLGGGEYLSAVPYLGFFAIFITVFNMLTILVSFFLSIKKTKVYSAVVMGAILQTILIFLFHKSFFQIIGVSLLASGLVLIILLIYYVKLFVNIKNIGEIISIINNPQG